MFLSSKKHYNLHVKIMVDLHFVKKNISEAVRKNTDTENTELGTIFSILKDLLMSLCRRTICTYYISR